MSKSNGELSNNSEDFSFSSDMTLEDIRASHRQFCLERNWGSSHTPRNVLLALVGEVGELAEIFQWKGEVSRGLPELSSEEKQHVGEEISDVLIYLVDLAAQCHVDLPAAIHEKMRRNALKYPMPKRDEAEADVEGATAAEPSSAPSAPKYSALYGKDRLFLPDRERQEGDGSE